MDKSILEKLTLYELREMGRAVGVKSPSSLKKKELIEKILKIQKGEEVSNMSEMTVKVKEVVKYGGHSLSANGSVNFTLKASYSELTNTIQLMQMLNNDVNSLSSFISDDWAGNSTGDAKAAEIEKNVKSYCAKYGLNYSDFEADVNYLRDVANDKASFLGAVGGILKTWLQGSKTKTQAAADANAVLNRLREKMRKAYEAKAPKKPETTTESK